MKVAGRGHYVIKCSCGRVVIQCRCAVPNKEVRVSEEPCTHKKAPEFKDLGPELFIVDGDVISYKGENFYRACNAFVRDLPDGGQSFCVKRVGHPGGVHEAYDGSLLRGSGDLG